MLLHYKLGYGYKVKAELYVDYSLMILFFATLPNAMLSLSDCLSIPHELDILFAQIGC